jgi:hypothetical protein
MKERSATFVQLVAVDGHALFPRAPVTAKNAEIGRGRSFGHQPRHDPATSGDDHIVAGLHGVEQGTQMGLGFGNADGLHGGSTWSFQMVIILKGDEEARK